MNISKLKESEKNFLIRYPGGFSNPEMQEIAKKHKGNKMNKLAQDSFKIELFENSSEIVESMRKVISQSSMVSVFEKPKFRDLVKIMSENEKDRLSLGLKEFLHGDQELGFELMLELLNKYKLAKWTLLTICSVYYRPSIEVFVKPTTAKKIIEHYELKELRYSPKPTYGFYKDYREQINQMKGYVDESLKSDNAAFCGFLMMATENCL